MDPTTLIILKLLAVAVLVFLNGFFVAAEFALVKIRSTQLQPLIQKGNRSARFAQTVLENLDASLSACQLGITLASLALGWIGEPIFAKMLAPVMDWLNIGSEQVRHTVAFVVGISTITFLHVTAGEQAPKLLAIQKPLPTSLWIARPLLWFYYLSYPFIWVLNAASNWMLRKVGIQPMNEHDGVHSDEELKLLIASSTPVGNQGGLGRSIVLNAFDLAERMAREVMRPRSEIVGLSTAASIEECVEIARQSRFSRFPLCEDGDLDRTLGVVHIKDLYALHSTAKTGRDLQGVAHRILYLPESARLEKLLQFFLERKLHFALVVDEYGGTVGKVRRVSQPYPHSLSLFRLNFFKSAVSICDWRLLRNALICSLLRQLYGRELGYVTSPKKGMFSPLKNRLGFSRSLRVVGLGGLSKVSWGGACYRPINEGAASCCGAGGGILFRFDTLKS